MKKIQKNLRGSFNVFSNSAKQLEVPLKHIKPLTGMLTGPAPKRAPASKPPGTITVWGYKKVDMRYSLIHMRSILFLMYTVNISP